MADAAATKTDVYVTMNPDGDLLWRRRADDARHREDGPAVMRPDGTHEWWQDGALHRDDGPALVFADGITVWYRRGLIHRDDGPAFEDGNGTRQWYRDDRLHRGNDLPASESPDGSKAWYVDGQRHRIGGPAVIEANGETQWWIDGSQLDLFAIKLKFADWPEAEKQALARTMLLHHLARVKPVAAVMEAAPALWSERPDRDERCVDFIRRVYAPQLAAGTLTLRSLGALDRPLYNAYAQWKKRHPKDEHLDLPVHREAIARALKAEGLDPDDAETARKARQASWAVRTRGDRPPKRR